MDLRQLGWNESFQKAFNELKDDTLLPARVTLEHKESYRIHTGSEEFSAVITGNMRFRAEGREDFPAVGDWVAAQPLPGERKALIRAVLPRKSKFSRQAAGNETVEQIIAANIDTVFLVNALNSDFNARRIERYLTIAWESGANPVIVLSKSDLCSDVEDKLAEVESIAFGVPIHVVSAEQQLGLEALQMYFKNHETAALLGSSGVGKSTLVNELYGMQVQQVKETRAGDDRGRHTTTHRELIVMPAGGMIIDTPGMRELQLWETEDSLSHSFHDIEALAEQCKFRDCRHQSEPGCAVKQAIEQGEMQQSRFDNYVKLQRELAYLERKNNKRAQSLFKQKLKK
ncbi:MAG TPA: ribosome small subunit-dependent GTPase A [Bacillales bacterium]|nr:ribosome small subunit-dependent GTPase A [Bacillales bacterium]